MFCCLLQVISSFDDPLCAGPDSRSGRCSGDPLPDPSAVLQGSIFDDFRENQFQDGNVTGCYDRYFYDEDGAPFQVYANFNCDDAPSDECRDCYKKGFARLKEGCVGRAGGTVLLEKCCVRYETAYDFCT
ncbi:unnamed protein product [Linum trigynum]